MNIAVIGNGYVGLTSSICFAEMGNNIVSVDCDRDKIRRRKEGLINIYEPGLKEMLDKNIKEQRISFTTNIESEIKNSEVIFIAVGTPEGEDYKADVSAVEAVAKK